MFISSGWQDLATAGYGYLSRDASNSINPVLPSWLDSSFNYTYYDGEWYAHASGSWPEQSTLANDSNYIKVMKVSRTNNIPNFTPHDQHPEIGYIPAAFVNGIDDDYVYFKGKKYRSATGSWPDYSVGSFGSPFPGGIKVTNT